MTELEHLRDFDLCLRQDNDHRQLTMQHQSIALVRPRILRAPHDGIPREHLAQCRNHFPLPTQVDTLHRIGLSRLRGLFAFCRCHATEDLFFDLDAALTNPTVPELSMPCAWGMAGVLEWLAKQPPL